MADAHPPPPSPAAARPRRVAWPILAIAALGLAIAGGGAALVFHERTSTPKLCPGTPALLASLRSPIEIVAYVTRGTPTLDRFVDRLDALLRAYERASAGKVRYRIVVARDEQTKKQAVDLGIAEQPFAEYDADAATATVAAGVMGLAFSYETERDVIKYLAPDRTDGLAFWIDNKIREVSAKAEGRSIRVGVLTGHGEISPGEANLVPASMGRFSMQGVITQNFPFYVLHDVDLRGGDAAIDESLVGLLVTQPAEDLSEKDLKRIDEFVMRGKAIAVFASAVGVRAGDASMKATLSTHGIEKLLAGYGIEMRRDAVIDLGRSAYFSVATASGIAMTKLPWIPMADEKQLDGAFPVFFHMQEIALPLASSLAVHAEKQPEATVRVVARSTPDTVCSTDDPLDLHPLRPWSAPAGARAPAIVAVAVEGTLRGAFDPSVRSTGRARVLVVSSSQFLANPLARAAEDPALSARMGARMPGDPSLAALAGPYAQQ